MKEIQIDDEFIYWWYTALDFHQAMPFYGDFDFYRMCKRGSQMPHAKSIVQINQSVAPMSKAERKFIVVFVRSFFERKRASEKRSNNKNLS